MTSEPDRLTDLELLVTHLQREQEQMHSVILAQQNEIDELTRKVAALKSEVEENLQNDEERDPNSERPPHY